MNHLFRQRLKLFKVKLTPYKQQFQKDWFLFYVVIFQLRKLHSTN
jgi:hypothetical protein